MIVQKQNFKQDRCKAYKARCDDIRIVKALYANEKVRKETKLRKKRAWKIQRKQKHV